MKEYDPDQFTSADFDSLFSLLDKYQIELLQRELFRSLERRVKQLVSPLAPSGLDYVLVSVKHGFSPILEWPKQDILALPYESFDYFVGKIGDEDAKVDLNLEKQRRQKAKEAFGRGFLELNTVMRCAHCGQREYSATCGFGTSTMTPSRIREAFKDVLF